jgi:hypothetical protein
VSDYTKRFSEEWQLVDVLYGDAVAANTESNTGYNSVANFHRVAIIIHPVDVNDALDVDIEQGTDTSGTGAKTVDSGSKDIAIATADTKPSVIELRMAEMDVAGGFDCLNVEVTTADTAGGGSEFAVEIWGLPRYAPASTTNLDSVTD